MAHATHLYFDHPQEPDPKEKGLTWAARYIDDRKVFDFRPDDLFGNAKKDFNGFMFSGTEKEKLVFFSIKTKRFSCFRANRRVI